MQILKSLSTEQLQELAARMGHPSYRATQLYEWLWQKGVDSFEEMTNLPKALREELGKAFVPGGLELLKQQNSADGTIKCLFATAKEGSPPVEAVLIPDFYEDGAANRLTVCVSSQVGCMFGCAFCATGKMGYFRNLEAWEIADQVRHINRISQEHYGKRITNVVYMGMGEPLHNFRAVLDSSEILTHKHGIGLSSLQLGSPSKSNNWLMKRLLSFWRSRSMPPMMRSEIRSCQLMNLLIWTPCVNRYNIIMQNSIAR